MKTYSRNFNEPDNEMIIAVSGTGKTFLVKNEIISLLNGQPNANVFVIDPMGEYCRHTSYSNGQKISFSTDSGTNINPLDLVLSSPPVNTKDSVLLAEKTKFIFGIFDFLLGYSQELNQEQQAVLNESVQTIYEPYIEYLKQENKRYAFSKCPTFHDLYQALCATKINKKVANELADLLFPFVNGEFETFSHHTNVEINTRYAVYDLSALQGPYKPLAMYFCANDIQNHMLINSEKDISTWAYMEEFQGLLTSTHTSYFLKRLWATAKRYNSAWTGIINGAQDLFLNDNTRALAQDLSRIVLMRVSRTDGTILKQQLSLSDSQYEYITNAPIGVGMTIDDGQLELFRMYDAQECA